MALGKPRPRDEEGQMQINWSCTNYNIPTSEPAQLANLMYYSVFHRMARRTQT